MTSQAAIGKAVLPVVACPARSLKGRAGLGGPGVVSLATRTPTYEVTD